MSHPLQELPGAISPGPTLGYFPNEHLHTQAAPQPPAGTRTCPHPPEDITTPRTSLPKAAFAVGQPGLLKGPGFSLPV